MSEQQPSLFTPEEVDGNGAGAAPPVRVRDIGAVEDGPLKRMMNDNFLRYASYVIRDRAIPDLRDGLKPVQRRLLHSLHRNDDGRFIKVANLVGYCMQFHPHGDASIGDALVALVNRRYLIEGQGNFGNLFTGDPAAAARYTECRLTPLAREELFHEDLTDFVPTYDGRNEEPVTLPARVPLLLMLGAEGIAVGVATRVLPHNFGELLEAQVAILHGEPFAVFPDFPQGGVMDASEYDRGRGSVRLRARVEVRNPQTLVIREIPCGATTDTLIASVEEAARKGKIRLRSIQDFTAERVEIEIQLDPEQNAERTVEALYAFTQCEMQVASRIVVIRDDRPVETDVEEVLRDNADRLVGLLKRRLKVQQRRFAEEIHRKTLLHIFIENRLYAHIERCVSPEEVEETVLRGLAPFRSQLRRDVTRSDIEALLELPIRRISRFDLEKNRREMARLQEDLDQAGRDLASIVPYAVRYLRNLHRKYAADYPRRTEIARFQAVEIRELTSRELAVRYDAERGYLGYQSPGTVLVECSSVDRLLLVWRDGRFKVVAPPEKLFVDKSLLYAGVLDRDRVLTAVYTDQFLTRLKRFRLGGVVTNRECRCTPGGGDLLFFDDGPAPTLYVRYADVGHQHIRQQEFHLDNLPVRDRDGKGVVLSGKAVSYVGSARPPDWDDALTGPPGRFTDL